MMEPFIIRVTEQDGSFYSQINPRLEFKTKEVIGIQTKIVAFEPPYHIVKSDNIDSLIEKIQNQIHQYIKDVN